MHFFKVQCWVGQCCKVEMAVKFEWFGTNVMGNNLL